MTPFYFKRLKEIIDQGNQVVAVTIVGQQGFSPAHQGVKGLVMPSGQVELFGCPHEQNKLLSVFSELPGGDGKPQLVRKFMDGGQESWLDLFVEPLAGEPEILIFGGGHISQPLVKIAKMIGFKITVVDDRQVFAHEGRFPEADRVICLPFETALERLQVHSGTYIVIVTRGHRYDQACLRGVIEKPAAYIGMIGSRSKVRLVLEKMLSEGIDRRLVEAVHSPIGLKIGAETPEEIAVSIMGEIISVRRRKPVVSTIDKQVLAVLTDTDDGQKKALVTIIRRQGSAPRKAGAKMAVLEDGRCVGTVGGGCVEAELRSKAFQVMDAGVPCVCRVDLTNDNAMEEGMVCGGRVEAFVEPVLEGEAE